MEQHIIDKAIKDNAKWPKRKTKRYALDGFEPSKTVQSERDNTMANMDRDWETPGSFIFFF